MKIFVGIPTYNRSRFLRLCLKSFSNSRLIRGFIIVAQGTTTDEYEEYAKLIKQATEMGFEVISILITSKLGSVGARNKVLDLARENLNRNDVLVVYEDDFIYPGDHTLIPALSWLKRSWIGLVGGKVINLRRRKIDPDFYLNIPYLADALNRLTGFIVLDVEHGPREVDFMTHTLAMRVEIISRGIKYDEGYGGTGYREENDLQMQVKKLGLKLVFEPRFYVYHLAAEVGGDRSFNLESRMYWKWRNHTYFMRKWQYPVYKKILSYMVLTTYALLNGPSAIKGLIRAVRGA
jgi:Predicted glycosyltransferases